MKLISTTPVEEDFSTPAWLQSIGYKPNFDYSWLAEFYDSSAYAIYKLNNDVFTTYTVLKYGTRLLSILWGAFFILPLSRKSFKLS